MVETSHREQLAPAGRPLRTPSFVAVWLVAWFAASTWFLGYPFTVHGQDAALRDRGLVLLLALTSVLWWRSEGRRLPYLLAFAAFALILGLESFAFGYGPSGELMAAWWNEKIMAVLMLACCAAGFVQHRRGADRAQPA